jgi:hypothetical protein
MSDLYYTKEVERMRERHDGHSWQAQYLCEPQPPLPPGTYCYYCSHGGAAILTTMCGKKDCREEHPSCGNRDCGCIAHMEKMVTI